MVESKSDPKLHLIKHICDISNLAKLCAHDNTFDSKPFIDWYIVFQVEDNANIDIIRRKYHRYALRLHPDKNKHPKAEFAFKLVSEAYACLLDEARRLEFDVKRRNNLKTTPQRRTKVKVSPPLDRPRLEKISARVKEVKSRFKEEARVIEKCLKTNAQVSVSDKEMPVFDPNDYATQGYPHFRVCKCNQPKSGSTWLKNIFKFNSQVRYDSPIFECKNK